jgi:hypothetical protein
MRKWALLSILAVGCGGSSNNNGNADMAMNGGGGDGGSNVDLAMGGVANAGTQILPAVLLTGVTTDDQVVAITASAGGVTAASLDGKTKTVIDAKATQVINSNKVVFTWELASASVTTSDTLTVWKAGATPRKVTLVGTNMASYALTAASTEAGDWILYADNSIDGGATDVYVAKFDGTGSPIKIASNADTNNMNCGVNGFGFGNKLFLFYCAAGGATATRAPPARTWSWSTPRPRPRRR